MRRVFTHVTRRYSTTALSLWLTPNMGAHGNTHVHVLYTRILQRLWVPVGYSRWQQSFHIRVTVCPLTSVASKIERRPCADLSQSCSCWLRKSKSFTRWICEGENKVVTPKCSCRSCDVCHRLNTESDHGLKVVITLKVLGFRCREVKTKLQQKQDSCHHSRCSSYG